MRSLMAVIFLGTCVLIRLHLSRRLHQAICLHYSYLFDMPSLQKEALRVIRR
jgi:hypothetical protein